ncbi:MAG: hypothetical protein GXP62_02020 [Oligoflexia bacterium]|nr:hypothetical protein [Oligoflexia bacterium]
MATDLSLHRSLYDSDAVADVAGRYSGVAMIDITVGPHDLVVRFDKVDPDVADILPDHFCNLALQETIVRRNQAETTMAGTQIAEPDSDGASK